MAEQDAGLRLNELFDNVPTAAEARPAGDKRWALGETVDADALADLDPDARLVHSVDGFPAGGARTVRELSRSSWRQSARFVIVYLPRLRRAAAGPRAGDTGPGVGSAEGTYDRIVAEVQRSWPHWSALHSLVDVDRAIEHAVHVTISMLQQDPSIAPAGDTAPDGLTAGTRVWSEHSGRYGVVVDGPPCEERRVLVEFEGGDGTQWHVKRDALRVAGQPVRDSQDGGDRG